MGVVDGKNSLKWMATTGGGMQASDQVFEDSDYYLSEEFVNQYANKIASCFTGSVEDDYGNEDWFNTPGQDDPTDGIGSDEMFNLLKDCTKNWKAASQEANKCSWYYASFLARPV